MPVKWTPDNDQMLLLKLLETHPQLTIDTTAISAAWPAGRDRPSPRAITERFVKIRQLAKASGAVTSHFSVSAAPGTPSAKHKRAPRGSKSGATPTKASGETPPSAKRKRGQNARVKQAGDSDDEGDRKVSKRELAALQQGLGQMLGPEVRKNLFGSAITVPDGDQPDENDSDVQEVDNRTFGITVADGESEDVDAGENVSGLALVPNGVKDEDDEGFLDETPTKKQKTTPDEPGLLNGGDVSTLNLKD